MAEYGMEFLSQDDIQGHSKPGLLDLSGLTSSLLKLSCENQRRSMDLDLPCQQKVQCECENLLSLGFSGFGFLEMCT